ncbi:hypothetical protein J6590_073735 [Homalodisca vitripennis]|nr:hypothetical protein J6590_073735 [Homalodisca vitripennis]
MWNVCSVTLLLVELVHANVTTISCEAEPRWLGDILQDTDTSLSSLLSQPVDQERVDFALQFLLGYKGLVERLTQAAQARDPRTIEVFRHLEQSVRGETFTGMILEVGTATGCNIIEHWHLNNFLYKLVYTNKFQPYTPDAPTSPLQWYGPECGRPVFTQLLPDLTIRQEHFKWKDKDLEVLRSQVLDIYENIEDFKKTVKQLLEN